MILKLTLIPASGLISFVNPHCTSTKQWGTITITNSSGIVITMPLTYQNTNYKILITHNNGTLPTSVVPLSVGYINPNYFYVSNNINQNPNVLWVTLGFLNT